jgi:hypothetical protein
VYHEPLAGISLSPTFCCSPMMNKTCQYTKESGPPKPIPHRNWLPDSSRVILCQHLLRPLWCVLFLDTLQTACLAWGGLKNCVKLYRFSETFLIGLSTDWLLSNHAKLYIPFPFRTLPNIIYVFKTSVLLHVKLLYIGNKLFNPRNRIASHWIVKITNNM